MTPNHILLSFSTVICCLTACKDKPAHKTGSATDSHMVAQPISAITGTWTGLFEHNTNEKVYDKSIGDSVISSPNKITLFIDHMDDGSIDGYSVCAGNDRPFSGSYDEEGDKITATLKEPGDNKNDGVFDLVIDKSNKSLTGTWKPYKKTKGGRHYKLVRKNFKYNASRGKYPQASMRLLTDDDVNNLYKDELRFMRNEIYARHGYSFKLPEVREMFEGFDWYMPISTDVRKKLTSIETKNEQTIKHFEKFAEEAYDDYGR